MAIRLSMSDPLKESTFPGAVVIAFSFLIVPMLDVVRVVLHRWRERKPLFLPDRNHIHHKFIALGLSQRQAMACIIGIALSFAVVNVFLIHCLVHHDPFPAGRGGMDGVALLHHGEDQPKE